MDGLESGDDSSRRSKPSIYDAAPIKATGPAIGACARRAGARASVPRSAGHCPFKFFPTGDTDQHRPRAGERAPLNRLGLMMRSHAILHGIAARSVGVQRVFSKD